MPTEGADRSSRLARLARRARALAQPRMELAQTPQSRRTAVTERRDDRLMQLTASSQQLAPGVIAITLPSDFADTAVDELGPALRAHVVDGLCQEIRLDGREVRSLTARSLGLLVNLSQLGAVHEVLVVIRGASPQLAAGLAIGGLIDRIQLAHRDDPLTSVALGARSGN